MLESMIIAALVLVVSRGFLAAGQLDRQFTRFAAVVSRIVNAVGELNYAAVRQRELLLGITVPYREPGQRLSERPDRTD